MLFHINNMRSGKKEVIGGYKQGNVISIGLSTVCKL